jgi:PKD repeat protein
MSNQLESALVIALRDTIKWESGTEAPASGTLTPVNPGLPFDATVYQSRDRQLAYRDLIIGAAVVEVSIQVGDVWNYSVLKPTLQGPVPFSLPFVGTEAGTFSSQIRHVTNVSIPYDAARYADADLYGRDSLVYEILARACESTFVDPSIPRIDASGTIIPDTSIWSLGQGAPMQADINAVLPLNRDLFKNPDRNLADRDNQLAGYVAQLAQVLKNPFQNALRLYVQVEAFGTVQREPDVYALTSDDGTYRVFQTEPALPGANQIIYSVGANTLQWIRERVDEVHVPQIYAMVIPGIEFGQYIETLAEVPERKDAQYWRGKAGQLNPEGIRISDTDIYLTTTNNDSVDGGYVQYGSASLTVPDVLTCNLGGSISQNMYRVSVLTKPNNRVEIAGAQNVSNTSGTLGGATFDVDVPSGSIATKVYTVDGGDGIVYNGSLYLNGDTFAGTSTVSAYAQYGVVPSSIRQYSIEYILALPEGPWNVRLEYTNISGFSDKFEIKGEYIASGSAAVTVIQDIAPIPFVTTNGNIVTTTDAGVDIQDTGPFSFPIYWTGGEGQLHIRKVIFESADIATGRYAVTGTFAGSVAHVDVIGNDKTPEVMRWEFYSRGTASGTLPFIMNYSDEPTLPLQVQQVQVQTMSYYDTTPLSRGFQGWRQECLDRAERAVQHGYDYAVQAYGTDVPEVRQDGTWWTNESSENWMAFVEVYNPRVRVIEGVSTDGIVAGRQYEVTTASVVYDGTVFLQGQKFYGIESSGTVYSGGTVSQVGAFIKSKAGHVGKPALMPRGLYFDDTDKLAKGYYSTAQATPLIATCQPWMIEAGLYVAHEDFWMPEVLGLTLPSDAIAAGAPAPVAFFVGAPVVGDFPLAVSFTNLSSGAEGATFLWDFGD